MNARVDAQANDFMLALVVLLLGCFGWDWLTRAILYADRGYGVTFLLFVFSLEVGNRTVACGWKPRQTAAALSFFQSALSVAVTVFAYRDALPSGASIGVLAVTSGLVSYGLFRVAGAVTAARLRRDGDGFGASIYD